MKKIYLSISMILSTVVFSQQSESSDVLENKLEFVNKNISKPSQWTFRDYTKDGNVDIATGAFGMSIPFFEIKEEDLDIPIGISYKTSGVKLNQNASEVGLNWELMAGAVITRTVKGHSDERNDSSNPGRIGGSQRYIFNEGQKPANHVNGNAINVYTTSAAHNGYIYTDYVAANILNKNREQFPRSGYDPPYEREASIAQVMYETNLFAKDDYEQDIFTVNLGNTLFHFSFKLTTPKTYDYTNNLIRVEGTALDEKGYKIFANIKVARILPQDSTTNYRVNNYQG